MSIFAAVKQIIKIMKVNLLSRFKVGNSLFETYSYLGFVIKHTSFSGWFVHNNERCLSMVIDLASAVNFINRYVSNIK